jgi:hypothetical protein
MRPAREIAARRHKKGRAGIAAKERRERKETPTPVGKLPKELRA